MDWIRKLISVVLAAGLFCACCTAAFAAERIPDTGGTAAYLPEALADAPSVQAGAAVLMDVRTGTVLYAKNENEQLYPASITKVLTALLTLEQCELDESVSFSAEAVYGVEKGSSTAGINVGAELTVEETLYAMLLVSANEAASALAEHISGSVEEFAALMTQQAKELGCTGSQFRNANGLPDEEHYTTAHDMALIMREALHYEAFRTIVGAKTYTIPDRDGLYSEIELWNHFKMLYSTHEYYYEYAKGGKTGYTTVANSTLISFAEKDGVELLCVILNDTGSGNHYHDTEALYEWGFEQVAYSTPLDGYDITAELTQEQLDAYRALGCTYTEDYTLLVPAGTEDLTAAFEEAATQADGTFGYVVIKDGTDVVERIPVTFDTFTTAAERYLYPEQEDAVDTVAPASDAPKADAPAEREDGVVKYVVVLLLVLAIIAALAVLRWTGHTSGGGRRRRRRG